MLSDSAKKVMVSRQEKKIFLIGNPNVGKSVIFNLLTGKFVFVSNYPGTTVEISEGTHEGGKGKSTVMDTPGTNSLIPHSEDEVVTRNILFESDGAEVLQVADAKNLQRALILTTQLAELEIPMVLALNMIDEAQDAGIRIDDSRLKDVFGVPVIKTVATQRKGLSSLVRHIDDPVVSTARVPYPMAIESAVAKISELLPESVRGKRALALMLMAGDPDLEQWVYRNCEEGIPGRIRNIISETQKGFSSPLGYVVIKARLKYINNIIAGAVSRRELSRSSVSAFTGRICQHQLWGVPVMLLVLLLMYLIVGKFGAGTVVDLLESKVFGELVTPNLFKLYHAVLPFPHEHLVEEGSISLAYELTGEMGAFGHVCKFIHDLFLGEYGLISMGLTYAVAIVLPIVLFFFILFGILEDSGYLPRLSIMSNRLFRLIGLHGKAVLPMVLGLGCDTMATLTTRILSTRKERLIATILLALAIPCSAQLGVMLGIMAQLPGRFFIGFILIIFMQLVIVGFLGSKILRGSVSDFIIEIPPMRLPQLKNVVVKAFYRLQWFLKEAVPLFLLGTLILFVANLTGALNSFQVICRPVVSGFLGLPAAVSEVFVMGFLRRDYGAAGLNRFFEQGLLTNDQVLTAMVVITLFVPCIAHFFVIVREHGTKVAFLIISFVFAYALLIGGILNLVLKML